MDLLFGTHTVFTLGVGGISNINENMNNLPTLQNAPPPKRRHVGEGLDRNQAQQHSERNNFVQGLQGTEPQGVGWMQQALGGTLFNALSSLIPPVSHRPPISFPTTNHSYGPGTAPSPFALNPVTFEGSYNPSLQSHLVPSQSSFTSVGTSHQQAVAPILIADQVHSHLSQVSHNQYRGDHTFYSHRDN